MKWKPRLKVYGERNNTFNPETFEGFSYGWWKYVAKIRGKVVFNDYRYSVTTAKHQRNMKALLKSLKIKIDLVVNTRTGLDLFKDTALLPMYEELIKLEIALSRTRDVKGTALRIKNIKRDISMARKLGAKFSRQDIKELKERLIAENNERLKKNREKSRLISEMKRRVKNEVSDLSPIDFKTDEFNNLNPISF